MKLFANNVHVCERERGQINTQEMMVHTGKRNKKEVNWSNWKYGGEASRFLTQIRLLFIYTAEAV